MLAQPKRCGLLAAALLLAAGAHAAAGPCGAELTARIPPRPSGAPAGTAFVEQLGALPREERGAAIVAAVASGNIPAFLRSLAPVVMTSAPDAAPSSALLCVMPDYLAIGSDADFVRMPMDLPSAAAVASALGFILPTPKIVDAIYEQAVHRFAPQPLAPGPWMIEPAYFLEHEDRIRDQARADGAPLGELTAGEKKDVVLTSLLARRPGHVAIYGWHAREGAPIQPLSTVHQARYADYSHGVRLVSQTVFFDGRRASAYEVLADARRAPLLSAEGAIPNARALMAARPAPAARPARIAPAAPPAPAVR